MILYFFPGVWNANPRFLVSWQFMSVGVWPQPQGLGADSDAESVTSATWQQVTQLKFVQDMDHMDL